MRRSRVQLCHAECSYKTSAVLSVLVCYGVCCETSRALIDFSYDRPYVQILGLYLPDTTLNQNELAI